MASILKNIFGGSSPSTTQSSSDDDFADFATNPDSSPTPLSGATVSSLAATTGLTTGTSVPYTKWYRVWERTSRQDFVQEAVILPFILLLVAFHFWGTRRNRSKARAWAHAHAPALQAEFAVVGYGGIPNPTGSETTESTGLGRASTMAAESEVIVQPELLLKEKSAQEFQSYATGRQNVAFMDVSIKMHKRYNPALLAIEYILSLFFESYTVQSEHFEAVAYTFDGREKELVPVIAGDSSTIKVPSSTYDGFVWAVVHKNHMRKFRQDRYDASLTTVKETPKLPNWVTVMTESAEISDVMLTPGLVDAIEKAGEALEYLIVTDQPVDKPLKIEETSPKKRIQLSTQLASSVSGYADTIPLFQQFLRLPDTLVSSARFRPEVTRKLRATREEEIRRLRRAGEDEKAEERKLAAEKQKKEERERLLRSMSADEQRKFLEREKDKEQRKIMKKGTRRT